MQDKGAQGDVRVRLLEICFERGVQTDNEIPREIAPFETTVSLHAKLGGNVLGFVRLVHDEESVVVDFAHGSKVDDQLVSVRVWDRFSKRQRLNLEALFLGLGCVPRVNSMLARALV